MDASVAEQLREKLNCSICLGLYRDPVTLPCGHNFCGDCIRDSWRRCEQSCPECREPWPSWSPWRGLLCSVKVLSLCKRVPGTSGAGNPGVGGQLRARLEVTQQRSTQAETQLQDLQQQTTHIQSSACTLASMVSSKFSCLLQALEKRQALALENIETAKTQALAQIQDEERQLRGHLEALTQYGRRVHDLLTQGDHQTFLQESQQLLEPPAPLGPRTPVQWDEDEQLSDLKESLSPLCGLLLEEQHPPRMPAKAAHSLPADTVGPQAPVSSMLCPLRKQLWQYYRNLTFDPASANRHFYLSHEDQQVTHHREPQGPARPGSFELWQVQCAQGFRAGRHYWEVLTSDHSVTLGVTYPELTRRKQGMNTDNIGRGPDSWGLCIQEDSVQAWHNGKAQRLPRASGRLLGMELDLDVGYLTFYSLEPQAQQLHTFNAFFNHPVYPVFWLLEGRTLTLCHHPVTQEAEI
ncbi:PREDICTED: tripartite motif-containing protein 65 [Dipodomys ordii]|uniref:Tripartite motif-containing protein 65 n=1 Tax=Dipodomys ordii TaxID=10020 RepID=A0A1S3GUH2_DIPOR|nr:PREDICTED: tripartite motif-containing protein 65 [Dipodomys ordii]